MGRRSACTVRLCCFSRETVTHQGGSSAMRLWLTSRTSTFFASHSQSGKDSMWFLQEGKHGDWLGLLVAFFEREVQGSHHDGQTRGIGYESTLHRLVLFVLQLICLLLQIYGNHESSSNLSISIKRHLQKTMATKQTSLTPPDNLCRTTTSKLSFDGAFFWGGVRTSAFRATSTLLGSTRPTTCD